MRNANTKRSANPARRCAKPSFNGNADELQKRQDQDMSPIKARAWKKAQESYWRAMKGWERLALNPNRRKSADRDHSAA